TSACPTSGLCPAPGTTPRRSPRSAHRDGVRRRRERRHQPHPARILHPRRLRQRHRPARQRRPAAGGPAVTANDLTVLAPPDALLRIDSVNPGLDPAGAGEAGIAAFVAGWGRAAGLRTQVLEGSPGRPSVILRGGQNTGGRRLLLCGHLDTVGLSGTRDALTP